MKREKSAIFNKVSLLYLEEITDASPASMLEIIDAFLTIVPEELNRIQLLIKQQSIDELNVAIHKLGPKYHYVGLTSLHETIALMQQKIQGGEVSDCLADLEEIEITTEVVIKDLHRIKEKLHRELQPSV